MRAIGGCRTYQKHPVLDYPVLLLPAIPPRPHRTDELLCLEHKRQGIATARRSIPDSEVHWMRNLIRDIPRQRPTALANRILGFGAGVE